MRQLKESCLTCGSAVISHVEDNVLPRFKMDVFTFACGATLKSLHASNGNTGRIVHSGCCLVEQQVSPI